MGRKFLLITTDQQRYDGLGCNGGGFAKTPVIDGMASAGIVFRQARNQCAVCMPARCTILTGQYVGKHGVTSNGIPLPVDHPSVVHELKRHGYETALIGKAHFEPHATADYFENVAAKNELYGPHRGFDYMELAGHTGRAGRSLFHYPKWLATLAHRRSPITRSTSSAITRIGRHDAPSTGCRIAMMTAVGSAG